MLRTLVAATAVVVALPSVASAHATLETSEAAPDTYYKAVVRISHGCDGEATHTVRATVPEGMISVKPMPKPGWEIGLEEADYERSYELHGRQITRGVRTITWTGGELPDNYFDEFVFRGRLAGFASNSVVYFPVTQECDHGEIAWSEIPAQGQSRRDLDRPAPSLRIVVADGGMAQDASTYQVGDLVVERPWSRATGRGGRAGGAYMTIRNDGHRADRLIGIASDVAGRVELHTQTMEDGVMKMRPVEDGIAVPPGGTVELKPGGLHVMLMGLAAPLDEGARFPVTLTFENAGRITVEVEVRPAGAMDAGMRHNN